MADVNEKLTENEKFVEIQSAKAIQNDDNKFKLTSKAALMQVHMNAFYDKEKYRGSECSASGTSSCSTLFDEQTGVKTSDFLESVLSYH